MQLTWTSSWDSVLPEFSERSGVAGGSCNSCRSQSEQPATVIRNLGYVALRKVPTQSKKIAVGEENHCECAVNDDRNRAKIRECRINDVVADPDKTLKRIRIQVK